MIFLLGTAIPYEVMPEALQTIANLMPLKHGIHLLQTVSIGQTLSEARLSFLIMGIVAIVGIVISVKAFKWE